MPLNLNGLSDQCLYSQEESSVPKQIHPPLSWDPAWEPGGQMERSTSLPRGVYVPAPTWLRHPLTHLHSSQSPPVQEKVLCKLIFRL